MKAYLEQLLRGVSDPIIGRNLVREYLQARIIANLQKANGMSHFGSSTMIGLRCWRVSYMLFFNGVMSKGGICTT